MKIHNLPQDISSAGPTADNSIIIHAFNSARNVVREKTVLDCNAISLVIEGEKTMTFTETTVSPNDREIHILSAGRCIASVDISRQKTFRSILIFFDDKELADFFLQNAAFIEKAMRSAKVKPSAYVAFGKDEFINHYIDSLTLMLKNAAHLSLPMKRIKLQELLLYLLENHTRAFLAFKNRAQLGSTEMIIRKVVESNLVNNLGIDEMAFLCNLSASTFKRQFNRIYGESPNTWILAQKMQLAAQMLARQKEKPAEIWFKLGFETHSGFTKSFRKHFGVAPKDYKKRLTLED
ncbi:helix-turn-helix domain-containing protein [Puia sp. P3]|uniref:helix-turn-helix domain-containing protein n=1 Tax=Puia sp. P3 TaxID=3423952 RepID=UPI003D6646E3